MFQIYLPIAGVSANFLAVAGVGLSVGLLSGMLGIGGGFLITPLLIFLGVPTPVSIATGANMAVATAAAAAQAHWLRGNVDVKMGTYLLVSGLAGSYAGVKVLVLLRSIGQFDLFVSVSYALLLGVVGAAMLVESLRAMRRASRQKPGAALAARRRRHLWIHHLPLKTRFRHSRLYISAIPPVVIGFIVGMLSSLMGVGGGFFVVPAMVYVLKMKTTVAVGTSLFMIVFVAGFTTFIQAVDVHSVDIVLASILIVAGVLGSQVGLKLGRNLAAEQLRAALAVIVLLVCIRVGLQLVIEPGELYSLSGAAGVAE
ncbi:MAG: sulfite exporter TauE/SafE family protein [Hyphomicrobiales bacterium]